MKALISFAALAAAFDAGVKSAPAPAARPKRETVTPPPAKAGEAEANLAVARALLGTKNDARRKLNAILPEHRNTIDRMLGRIDRLTAPAEGEDHRGWQQRQRKVWGEVKRLGDRAEAEFTRYHGAEVELRKLKLPEEWHLDPSVEVPAEPVQGQLF